SSCTNDSFRYHGWSKNAGCFEGSVPSILRRFNMLSPELARGIGKAMTSPSGTMGVVDNSAVSLSVNLLGTPISVKRRSTSVGESEIICDRFRDVVVVSSG